MRRILMFLALLVGRLGIQRDISTLHNQLYSYFWSQNTTFIFMRSGEHLAGLFETSIRFNIVDTTNSERAANLRQFTIDDASGTVTSYVLYGLLEAEQLGTIKINRKLFNRSLNALASFHNDNYPPELPIYFYWPPQKFGEHWRTKSANLEYFVAEWPSLPLKLREPIEKSGAFDYLKFLSMAHIPPDLDDSAINVILLAFMKEIESPFYSSWHQKNSDIDGFFQRILYYSYRPFSHADNHSNQIDPRSYFILHKFLRRQKEEADAKGVSPKLFLPTAWLLNYDQNIPGTLILPQNANDVDGTNAAYFILALISQMKGGYDPSVELREMLRDTCNLVVYTIEEAIYQRPDLILMYYPSKYTFYWFASRVVGALQSIPVRDADLQYVYEKLGTAVRNVAIPSILREKIEDSHGCHWSEFLGNFAGKNRDEDAISTTAEVVNTLFEAWGVRDHKSFKYLAHTPAEVKAAVRGGVTYLRRHIHAKKSQLAKMLFSVKKKISSNSERFQFPANKIVDEQNRSVNAQAVTISYEESLKLQIVAKGYIQDDEYQRMLKMKWFGNEIPTFKGLNDGEGPLFIYWTSPAFPKILSITALSKYYRLAQKQ